VIKVITSWDMGDHVSTTNQFWEYDGGPPSSADCEALASDWDALLVTHVASLLSAEYSIAAVEVIDLSTDTGGEGAVSSLTAGTRAGVAAGPAVSTLVSFKQPRRYQGGHPRSYYPFGVAADLEAPQAWSTDFLTAVTTAQAGIWGDFIGTTSTGTTILAQVNVGYKHAGAVLPVPHVDVIQSYLVSSIPASQRRRNGRRR
jgi:hypothetical protein